MLNNKSVMLKVLVLALSVLMLVSLAACNQNAGVAEEDVNNAIASALASQSAAQAEKDAALQSSIAADQAKQDAEQSAALESMQSQIAATTTAKPATTTTAAAPKEDITAVQAELAKQKHQYTYSPAAGLYSSSNYTDLVLLFEKASVEMMNATTVAQAQVILENTKVAAAAIPCATNAAKPVQAKIEALGDIETAVFTTAATKVKEARKALESFMAEYEVYCDVDADDFKDTGVVVRGDNTAKVLKKLGINEADLIKAEGKVKVLNAYIESALLEDMKALYLIHGKVEFDEEGDELATVVGAETAKDVIARAYYRYLILAAVNGGDVADAKLAINWEYAVDAEGNTIKAAAGDKDPLGRDYVVGKKKFDAKKPTAFFTAEQFINVYATPYLNAELRAEGEKAITDLETVLTSAVEAPIYTGVKAITSAFANSENFVKKYVVDANGTKATWTADFLVEFDDVEDAIEDIFDAYEAEIEALTYVGNYKGTKTMAQAKADIWAKWTVAYVKAANEIVKASQAVATDNYAEYYEAVVDGLDEYYENREGEKYTAAKAEKLANADSAKTSFLANAAKAPAIEASILSDKTLAKKYGYTVQTSYNEAKALAIAPYVAKVTAAAITDNFTATLSSAEAGLLGDYSARLIEDLLILRDRLDPTCEDDAELYLANPGTIYTYRAAEAEKAGWIDVTGDGEPDYCENAPVYLELVAKVDAAIENISKISVSQYSDKKVNGLVPNKNKYDKAKGKALYWQTATAKEMFMDQLYEKYPDATQKQLEAFALTMVNPSNATDATRLVTTTATSYPIQFVYTASEQAREAAGKVYVAVYDEINLQMLNWFNVLAYYARQINEAPAYVAALEAAKGNLNLTNELEAIAREYMDDIGKLKQATNTVANGLQAAYGYNANLGATHFTDYVETTNLNKSGKSNAERYLQNTTGTLENRLIVGYDAERKTVHQNFTNLMFGYKTDNLKHANLTVKECTVIQLWQYKTAMAHALSDLKAQYKNSYTPALYTDPATGVVTTIYIQTPAVAFAPQYDIGLSASSARGQAYEAQIDALFDACIANIMNVRMNLSRTVTNVEGTKIVNNVKASSIANAKKIVNGYIVELLGADANATNIPGFSASTSNSGTARVDKTFEVYYKGNFN